MPGFAWDSLPVTDDEQAGRTFERLETGNLQIEDVVVEEEQGAKRLILRRCRGMTCHGQFVHERGHFLGAHLP